MARLNETQLAALDLMIAKMTADKVEGAQISADFTDAIADVFEAIGDAVADAADAIGEAFEEIGEAFEEIFGQVVLPADRATALREKLQGREPPSLEELIALRSHYRK